MDLLQELYIIEQIKTVKSRYFRAVDLKDRDILLSVVADQITLDFSEAMHDPATGYKPPVHIPAATLPREKAVNIILGGLKDLITVHQGLCPEITVIDEHNATAVWSMHDKVFFKEPTGYRQIVEGYGYYYDSYQYENNSWKLSSTRVTRLWANITR